MTYEETIISNFISDVGLVTEHTMFSRAPAPAFKKMKYSEKLVLQGHVKAFLAIARDKHEMSRIGGNARINVVDCIDEQYEEVSKLFRGNATETPVGKFEKYLDKDNKVNPAPAKIPHRCPVCRGRRSVPKGYYPENSIRVYRLLPDECRTCDGLGIILI